MWGEAEAGEDVPHFSLHAVPPLQAELLLEVAKTVEQLRMAGVVMGDGLQFAGQRLDFPLDTLQLGQGGHCLGEERPSLGDDAVLGEVADSPPLGKLQLAGGVLDLTGD